MRPDTGTEHLDAHGKRTVGRDRRVQLGQIRYAVPLVRFLTGVVFAAMFAGSMGSSDEPGERPEELVPNGGWGTEAVETVDRFEPNAGQFAEPVDHVLRSGATTVFLTGEKLVFDIAAIDDPGTGATGPSGRVIEMAFVGADPAGEPAPVVADGPTFNYFVGDTSQWVAGQRAAGEVTYENLVGSTDVRFLSTAAGLRYDLKVEPGTDPGDLQIQFSGHTGVSVEPGGDLVVAGTEDGELVFSAPRAYQHLDGRQLDVPVSFSLGEAGTVGFAVGGHDPSLPLVIDPTLELGTFIGDTSNDRLYGMALDSSDNTIVVGEALSATYPTTVGAYDTTANAGTDIVVTKLNQAGTGLIWSTFVGGSGNESAQAVVVNNGGDVVVGGTTASADFPTTAGAYDTSHNGGDDAVVFELSSSGSALNASTFFGGTGSDASGGLDVDSADNVVVGGDTTSTSGIASSGAYDTSLSTGPDGFVAEFDAALTGRTWATYLGGTGTDEIEDVDVDNTGDVWVAAVSGAAIATTSGAFDTSHNGSSDAYIARISNTGAALEYGTYLGGSGSDRAVDIEWRSSSEIFVAATAASGFPTSAGAYDTSHNGSSDGAAVKLNPTASGSAQLLYSTFLGGSSADTAYGMDVDSYGRVFVTGSTASSSGMTTAGAPDTSLGGSADAFLAVLSTSSSILNFGTYIGGTSTEFGHEVVLASDDRPVVAGYTDSADFITTSGAYDRTHGGGSDGFVHRYSALAPANVVEVNSTGDATDASAGNGACTTGGTNSAGVAACTLRAAIQEANASALIDTIRFDIPTGESGYSASPVGFAIQPSSLLPEITVAVTIDGSTQPQYSSAGRPVIEIDGVNVSASEENGLWITGGGSTVRGLAINRFGDDAIDLEFNGGNTIVGNYVGTDVTGLVARANAWGINIKTTGNVVGGTTAADRNVVSGNTQDGFYVRTSTATGNVIKGNYVGLSADGASDLGNGGHGLYIFGSAASNTVGGLTSAERNVISGNAGSGVYFADSGTASNLVRGNWIGTNGSGGGAVGNSGWGVYVASSAANNQIGGTADGAGNLIRNNTGGGVAVTGTSTGNRIARNLINTNGGVEIDLAANGTTTNDGVKQAAQPNQAMDQPVFTSAVLSGSTLTVTGYVGSAAGQSTFGSARVEVFEADAESSNRGGSTSDLGNFSADSSGNFTAQLTVSGLAVGEEISATATDASGNTSEFGVNATVLTSTVVVNSTADGVDASIGNGICQTSTASQCTLRAAVAEANASGVDTIHFNVPAALVSGTHLIAPSSALPAISAPVTIDASTEPDFSAAPVVTLSGENSGAVQGLILDSGADNSTIRGLVLRDWGDDGIEVQSGNSGSTIAGNYIGRLTVAGVDSGVGTQNTCEGVWSAGSDLTIGGPDSADRNVLSGNGCSGIHLDGETADGTRIENNHIGVTASASGVLANGADGISITLGADGTTIVGNIIVHPNGDGIDVSGASSGTVMQGNAVGTNFARSTTWTGKFAAISLEAGASNTLIGGTGVADGNIIANSGFDAANPNNISVWSDAGSGISILGNSIYDSQGRAIDLNPNGVTANDPGDGDTGPNDLLNFPVITSATVSGGTVTATFNLDAPANPAGYRVELFRNPGGANPVGNWEGEELAAAITVSAGTGLTHTFAGSLGDVVTATATRIDVSSFTGFSSTSEISASATVTGPLDPVVLDDIQKGVATLAAGSATMAVTIDPVTTTASFLTFSLRGDDSNPNNLPVTGELANATTITFDRYGTTGALVIDWAVVEFSSGVTVQRGSTTLDGSSTTTAIPITAVNTARSLALVNQRAAGTAFAANDFLHATLSSTALSLTKVDGSGNNIVKWQVVTYNDSFVQAGTVALAPGAASATATVSSVDTSQAWLVYTASSAQGTDANIGQKLVMGSVSNSTTLSFERSSTGQAMTVAYFLIEFTDATTVQRGTASFGTATTTTNATITAVDPARAISVGGYMSYGGRSAYTADDNPGVGWFTSHLTTGTNLQTQRAVTGSAPADLGWSVIHWPGTAPDTVEVNSTADTADLFLGDGYCDTGQANSAGRPACSLRAAVEEANASAAIDSIVFDLPTTETGHASGVWTISPDSALSSISSTVSIDASTQTGYGAPSAAFPSPVNGSPVVRLDRGAAPSGTDGLSFAAGGDGSVVRGLSITGFSGTNGAAIQLSAATGVSVVGNHLGVAPDGIAVDANDVGVDVAAGSSAAVIGGAAASDRNLIDGNAHAGITIGGASGTLIRGNEIGRNGGSSFGVVARNGATGASVGGVGTGEGNLVTGAGKGVAVDAGPGSASATIVGNHIRGNSGLGIDLADDGATPNDDGDSDSGPNDLLNVPVITAADESGGSVEVAFTLDVPAGSYRVEFFRNPSGPHVTGFGEGEVLVHAALVTHPGGGPVAFTTTMPGTAGDVVTATTTHQLGVGSFGATSEFSAATTTSAVALVIDSSVRRSDLRTAGGLTLGGTTGIAGSAVELAGGNQRLVGPATDLNGSQMTLSGWARLDTLGTDPRIVAKAASDGAPVYELLVDDGTGQAVARLATTAGVAEARGGSVPVGSWQFLAATWDGSTLRLYLNGSLVGSAVATGSLNTNLALPMTVGNLAAADRGVDGRLDQIQISHTARSAAWIATTEANLRQPGAFVTLGGVQTQAAGAWATTSAQSRSGARSLVAPDVGPGGLGAWITAVGLDEPGVEFESWWRLSNPTVSTVAAGTRTGAAPTDQYETALTASGFDLATLIGATRTLAVPAAGGLSPVTWTKVVIRTDQLGVTTVSVGGANVIGPHPLAGGPANGSVGLRAGDLPGGQSWHVDDVQLKRLVSDEPTVSLGQLDRQ